MIAYDNSRATMYFVFSATRYFLIKNAIVIIKQQQTLVVWKWKKEYMIAYEKHTIYFLCQ